MKRFQMNMLCTGRILDFICLPEQFHCEGEIYIKPTPL
jgi:hypothetical protein